MWLGAAIVIALLLCATGCTPGHAITEEDATLVPSDAELRKRLDDALEFTQQHRHLSIERHAAWQILHGALAWQKEFQVELPDGEETSAIDYLLAGGEMNGWTAQAVLIDRETGRYGLRAIMEPGTKTGQGHHDQWLAILSQADLPVDQTVQLAERQLTIDDWVTQVQLDIHRNAEREFSWTLIGLTRYRDTGFEWRALDGSQWSIARMMQSEAERPVGDGACGGTHRLIGMTMALQRHREQNGALHGPWALAEERIQEAVARARNFQNDDGSFSTNYLARGGRTPDLAQNLGTTGHVLEFLTLALSDEELRQPWVKRAAAYLCNLFERTKKAPLECGALYHAAHALVLYRERVYGVAGGPEAG